MIRLLLATFISLAAATAMMAQSDAKLIEPDLEKRLVEVEKKLARSEADLKRVRDDLSKQAKQTDAKIDSITKSQQELKATTAEAIESLDGKSRSTEKTITEKFETLKTGVKDEITSSTMLPVYGLVGVVLLTIGGFVFFRHRAKKDVDEVIAHVDATRASLQAESVQLDEKLLSFLEGEVERPGKDLAKDDHSLPLKVADELVRIQNYVSAVDPSVKGVKHINASIKRIEDFLLSRGYEIPQLLGRDYVEGMKAIASFKPDDAMAPGEQRITRIVKPQVNFNGQMIQAAEIEVSHG